MATRETERDQVTDAAESFLNDTWMLRTLLDSIQDGVYFTDRQRRIQYWNKGAERISGYLADDVVGHQCADNILMHIDCEGNCVCTSSHCPLLKCFKGKTNHTERLYLKHKEGHRVAVRICAAPIHSPEGELIGGLETFHDVSSEIAALQELDTLKEEALLCPLTGVGNRRYCEQMLDTHLRTRRLDDASIGILFIDVDDFKTYNDRFGHDVGDVVLKMVARTLARDLRNFDFLGRWGGEEFLIVLPRMKPEKFEETANRLRVLVEASSTEVSNGKLSVTVSVGATMAEIDESPEKAVARADKLMYQSKTTGKNKVTLG